VSPYVLFNTSALSSFLYHVPGEVGDSFKALKESISESDIEHDNSMDLIRDNYPQAQVRCSDGNLGFPFTDAVDFLNREDINGIFL
jgi:hypothetical protein